MLYLGLYMRCDLLKFHYLCGRITNLKKGGQDYDLVVICSNFTTFAVESPTRYISENIMNRCDLLKFHYLCGRITNVCESLNEISMVVICSNFTTFAVESPTEKERQMQRCSCDLLKFHYLCGRITNHSSRQMVWFLVVICSNFTTFAVESPTTRLRDGEKSSCDLLKFHYLCGRITNCSLHNAQTRTVVICSNFTTFAVESPTHGRLYYKHFKL